MSSAAPSLPSVDIVEKQEGIDCIFSGKWLTRNLSKAESKLILSSLNLDTNKKTHILFSRDFESDTAGSWIIAKFLTTLQQHQINYKAENCPHFINELIGKKLGYHPEQEPRDRLRLLEELGKKSIETAKNGWQLTGFFGEVLIAIYDSFCHLKNWRWISIARHLQTIGLQAVPIVGLISFLIGAVLAYQGVIQLNKFGASIYTIDFLSIALLRELSVLLTSIVIAGRSGSSFTAEIGTMSLNQEIDAIRILGLNPILVLVLPRIIALLISLPILVMFSMLAGCIGGMVLTTLLIDVSVLQFWQILQKSVSTSTFWVGMSKAPLCAVIIGIVGCYRGMQVRGSAESIGLMTTQSVVESIFLVIVFDALMSIVYSSMGI